MKKVFIVHGFEGSPNGGWRPWLMAELAKLDIYAAALSMPDPQKPVLAEWVREIARHIDRNRRDELYLVGHSLGVPAILRYLESSGPDMKIAGVVLVSGPCEPVDNEKIKDFLAAPFDFAAIRGKVGTRAVIHGDNDTLVPLAHAEKLSRGLEARMTIIKNGGHLNGSSGWLKLPEGLRELSQMMGSGKG